MDSETKFTPYDWLAGFLLGTALGVVVLGIGGRIAMRGIALYLGQRPGLTLGGSLTVVFLGALCGAGGGVLLVLTRLLFPRRSFVRAGLFWTVSLLVTLRGLRPVDPVKLVAFVPPVLVFGAFLYLVWCRLYIPRRADSSASRYPGRSVWSLARRFGAS